jgi:uncharacterized membrane protein YeaQ/YmgE (transglycosylase-associated protein family)
MLQIRLGLGRRSFRSLEPSQYSSPFQARRFWMKSVLANHSLYRAGVLAVLMFVPGIISLAFYKRRPSRAQVILGLVATVVLSALLGYVSPPVPFGQLGSVILAVVGGVILYVAILAILLYWYQPRHAKPRTATPPAPAP